MRPYRYGRNKRLTKWRRAGSVGKVLLYLKPFYNDLRVLWQLGTPCPTSLKLLTTLTVAFLLVAPILLVPALCLATYASVRMITTDPDDWNWDFVDVFGLLKYHPSPQENYVCRRLIAEWFMFLTSLMSSADYYRVFRDITALDPLNEEVPNDINVL